MNCFKCIVAVLILAFDHSLSAQSVNCDGNRYLNEVFGKTTKTTVPYGRNAAIFGDSIDLFMDIYQPEGDVETKRPAIVMAFGGAYISGDRTQLSDLAQLFSRHGYVTACIDYRIWPIFLLGFPDSAAITDVAIKAMGDMKASIRYLRSEATRFKIDTSLIFSAGISAGAITAIHSAYLDAKDSIPAFLKQIIEKNGGINGNSNKLTNFGSQVAGILNLSGGIFKTDWIDKGEPPIVSMHGTADNVVPYNYGLAAGVVSIYGSGSMHPVMKDRKIKELLVSVPGGMHTDIYFEATFKPFLDSFTLLGKKMFNDIVCKQIISSNKNHAIHRARVYPNPAIDYILIETDIDIESASMYDLAGRAIPVNLDQNRLDWSRRLSPGVYTIEMRLKDRSRLYTKVLIQ